MDERIHLTFMDVVLDNDKKEYQAGDKVSGNLKIRFNGRLHFWQIKINLTCIAQVKWVENPGTRYHRAGHVYHDKKNILEFTYAIPAQYDESCLSAGEHEIPFTFKLPEQFDCISSKFGSVNRDIPSSFNSPHGSVTYYIEAIVDEPAINDVHKIGAEIVVDAPIRDNLKLSIGNSVEKDFGVLSLASGIITLYANLSQKGFVAGDVIELHTTVENKSTVDATPRAILYQKQIYMCGERHKAFDEALTDYIVGRTVVAGDNGEEMISIPIPEYVSLTIKSGMVNIKYFVHVTADIPHAFDIHVNLPIIITTKLALEDSEME